MEKLSKDKLWKALREPMDIPMTCLTCRHMKPKYNNSCTRNVVLNPFITKHFQGACKRKDGRGRPSHWEWDGKTK